MHPVVQTVTKYSISSLLIAVSQSEYVEYIQPKPRLTVKQVAQRSILPYLRLVLQNISSGMLHQASQIANKGCDVNHSAVSTYQTNSNH
jgi:hypothetical protein